jgi:hypothetical protein
MNRIIIAGAALFLLGSAVVANQAGAQGNAPFAGGGQADAKDPAVDKLEANALKLEKQSKAKPKDAKLKLKVADAFYQTGHAMMFSDKLGPRVKYRGALKNYRTALSYDPGHKKAAEEKKTIEDIYKSMGRDVPK